MGLSDKKNRARRGPYLDIRDLRLPCFVEEKIGGAAGSLQILVGRTPSAQACIHSRRLNTTIYCRAPFLSRNAVDQDCLLEQDEYKR
jgi:hypothetical protein